MEKEGFLDLLSLAPKEKNGPRLQVGKQETAAFLWTDQTQLLLFQQQL